MGIEWWEYYEMRHNFKNLQEVVAALKKEVDSLKAELARIKGIEGRDNT